MALTDLNKRDLWFTVDGDFLIDGSGDLRDTEDSSDRVEGLRQAILHRVAGERGANREYPDISSGLEEFIGRTVNKDLIQNIEFAIHRSLVSDGVLSRGDYNIRILELTPGDIAILIYVNLAGQEHPIVSMAWNIRSGEITRVL